jgi:hypothetical protein
VQAERPDKRIATTTTSKNCRRLINELLIIIASLLSHSLAKDAELKLILISLVEHESCLALKFRPLRTFVN